MCLCLQARKSRKIGFQSISQANRSEGTHSSSNGIPIQIDLLPTSTEQIEKIRLFPGESLLAYYEPLFFDSFAEEKD